LPPRVPPEPPTKRVVSFFDGQNLFWHAKAAVRVNKSMRRKRRVSIFDWDWTWFALLARPI